jgi:hypothetical protein
LGLSFVADFDILGKRQDATKPDMAVKIGEKAPDGSTGGTGNQPKSVPQDVLESWKEIAASIGRDERTAMRWAKEQGMPVRRTPGKRGRVYASRAEIATWLAASGDNTESALHPVLPQPTGFARRYILAVVLLLAIVGVGAILWTLFISRMYHPVRVRFSSDSFQALRADGGVLWTHSFSAPFDLDPTKSAHPSDLERFVRITDLLGDGNREIILVAPLWLTPNSENSFRMEIDCFSSGGKLLWFYSPHEMFKFGDSELEGPWILSDIMVSRQGRSHSIYAAFNHWRWGNSFIVEIDPASGRGIVRFVNTGTTRSLGELQMARATYLLVGGFNNERDGGSLAMIEEGRPFGASPQTAGTRHECVSCPPGVPDFYFVFPRSELDRLRKAYENPIINMNVAGSGFEVAKGELIPEGDDRNAQTYYNFRVDPTIHPHSLRYDSYYDMLHREAEKNGELDHSLAKCPERLHPLPVRAWTSGDGWKELAVRPSAP